MHTKCSNVNSPSSPLSTPSGLVAAFSMPSVPSKSTTHNSGKLGEMHRVSAAVRTLYPIRMSYIACVCVKLQGFNMASNYKLTMLKKHTKSYFEGQGMTLWITQYFELTHIRLMTVYCTREKKQTLLQFCIVIFRLTMLYIWIWMVAVNKRTNEMNGDNRNVLPQSRSKTHTYRLWT